VCGPNKSYLWILAREPHMEESLKSKLVKKAKDLGFETKKMIYVSHKKPITDSICAANFS
jgi:apolipoprotein D and lipocalin family protein